MNSPISGWSVERLIPSEVWSGLVTGQYTLHGGVIRWAAGTPTAGQIVRHLVPIAEDVVSQTVGNPLVIPSAAGNIASQVATMSPLQTLSHQIDGLAAATQFLLKLSTGTMILAGLNLAVSAVGFIALNKKLGSLDATLTSIQNDIKEIRDILKRAERAKLRSAIQDLQRMPIIREASNRNQLLHRSRGTLGELYENYKDLYCNASSIETAVAAEEYFCITTLARIRCSAELGEFTCAYQELGEAYQVWRKESRRVVNNLLLGTEPERFLASDLASEVPSSTIIDWMNFAHDEHKGCDQIDKLRAKTRFSVYRKATFGDLVIANSPPRSLQREKELVIPLLQKFVNRNVVLDGYLAQYHIMENANLKPSEYEERLNAISPEMYIDGFIILKPDTNGL